MGMKDKIDKLRKIHVIVTVSLFFSTLIFCSYIFKNIFDLDLTQISLSDFGIYKKLGILWNTALFLIALQLYHISSHSFSRHNLENKKVITLFRISTIFLILTACINMNHELHHYVAWLYFIAYPISIFYFGYNLVKIDFRMGITSMIVSVLSLLLPTISIFFFTGFAIPEIIHTVSIMVWSLCIYYEDEYKRILKFINL